MPSGVNNPPTLARHCPTISGCAFIPDDGLVGLGETYYLPRAVSAVIHDLFAPLLIGRDAVDIENHWNNLFSLVNFCGFAGAEMRAISAIDVALWDLLGQHTRTAHLQPARRPQSRERGRLQHLRRLRKIS